MHAHTVCAVATVKETVMFSTEYYYTPLWVQAVVLGSLALVVVYAAIMTIRGNRRHQVNLRFDRQCALLEEWGNSKDMEHVYVETHDDGTMTIHAYYVVPGDGVSMDAPATTEGLNEGSQWFKRVIDGDVPIAQ
jgi:hypothetical protein